MKHAFTLFITAFLFLFYAHIFPQSIPIDNHKTPLVVVLMVKNEADVVLQTLQPFVDAGIDSYLLYDTGSDDNTPTIVRTFFKKNKINHGYVIEESFVDFATSRNRALDLAESIFPRASFILMPDAEWYIQNAHMLVQFCQNNKNNNSEKNVYSVRLLTTYDSMEHYTSRLIRCRTNVRFVGVVHEIVNKQASGTVPSDIYFEYIPKSHGIEKSKKRWVQDCALLHKHLESNPNHPRTLFYLAQTYQFLNDWDNAITYYTQRYLIENIFTEEQYLAAYRIGCAIEHCIENNCSTVNYEWEDAFWWYMKAHSICPYRAEPLVRIAWYYLIHNEKEIAFLFASRAVELPFPSQNGLFVEKKMYDYVRYDILGQCAFNVGEYEKGKDAVLKALKEDATLPHLYYNLGLYLNCISL